MKISLRRLVMRKQTTQFNPRAVLFAASLLSAALVAGGAHAQGNFYAGKTLTLIATTAPGGTGEEAAAAPARG